MPSFSGIYFAEYLPRQESTEYTIIYLHGAGGNHLCWPSNLRRLPNVHTLSIDLPGHGRSDPPGRQSIGQYGSVICEWLRKLSSKNLVLAGYGLGGYLALHCAALQNDIIGAVMLVNPFIRSAIPAAAIDGLRNRVTAQYGKTQAMHAMSLSDQKPCLQEMIKAIEHVRPTVLAGDLMAWFELELSELISRVFMPVGILESAYNERKVFTTVQAAAREQSETQVNIHKGCNTYLSPEYPTWVAARIMDFLHQIPALIRDPFEPATYAESYIPEEGKYAI